jgi:tetratricopeptide (TPR) repeat protein
MISDSERWRHARSLFDELVELPTDEREKRLEAVGRDDPHLRMTVERLLEADERAEATLGAYSFGPSGDDPAPTPASRDPLGIVGRTVSHFRVTGYIAAGGMGVVYAAEDVQLGRTVALKFPHPHHDVDPAVAERFVQEARTAAALDHPNLCTVHEIGESEHGLFLAMPLYSGETLRDRLDRDGALPPDETLDIIIPVVNGLASAHAAGIVHRDLKPGNVMLLADGPVKVLDFGLAKIRDVDLTTSRMTLGTLAYVAPEQISRDPVDARTDLWAIGVMLYESLTGVRPFRGDHEVSILNAVVNEEPVRPTILRDALPPAFDDLIGALLEKEPAARYQSAQALLADLEALRRGNPLGHRPAKRRWFRAGRRSRIWAGAAVAAAATVLLAAALINRPGLGEPPANRTIDPEAYELYSRARHAWKQRTRESMLAAPRFYEAAVEREPGFARAWAGLGEAYINIANFGWADPEQSLHLAERAADRALELDSGLPEAHAAKGFALASRLQYAAAESSFRRAIGLDKQYAWAHHYFSLMLLMQGRTVEAREQNREALRADPLSRPASATTGIILLQEGDTRRAIPALEGALRISPDMALARFYLGAALLADGSPDAALSRLEGAAREAPDYPGVRSALSFAYRSVGRAGAADSILNLLRADTSSGRARLNLAFAEGVHGNHDAAIQLMGGVPWDVPGVIGLRADPLLARLRADPRMDTLLVRLTLGSEAVP